MASPTEEKNKAILRRLFEEFNDHNVDIVDELFAEGCQTDIYRVGTKTPLNGREEVKALLREYWETFPDLEGEFIELIAEADRIAFFREVHGTHERDFRGIRQTGQVIRVKYAGYALINDGEIVHFDALGNMMHLLEQLGVELPIEG